MTSNVDKVRSSDLPAEPLDSSEEVQALFDVLGLQTGALDTVSLAVVRALAHEVLSLRAELKQSQDALSQMALLADIDPLCDVFNRRAFERELVRELARAERAHLPLSLIYIDLDHFKRINDCFGHARGDQVLKDVAALLTRNVRKTDIIGRLGGDEFGIVLTWACLEDARRKVKILQTSIEKLGVGPASEEFSLGASCGCIEWQPGQSASALIDLADEAMFTAKHTSRQQV